MDPYNLSRRDGGEKYPITILGVESRPSIPKPVALKTESQEIHIEPEQASNLIHEGYGVGK